MIRFWEKEIAKETFYVAKKPIKIWDVNGDNTVVSKLIETKPNSKYVIGIKFDKATRPLVLIMPEMRGYVKAFNNVEDKINKLMPFHIVDEKLLEKYKAIRTKIKNLESIELDALLVYDNKYDEKYYLQVFLDNCPYEIVHKQMTNDFDENPFRVDIMLIIAVYI